MTVFIGGTGFGDCVEFDSVEFSGAPAVIGGKNMGTDVGFSIEIASAKITVDRFPDIAIDLVESLREGGQVQVGAGGGAAGP